MEFPPRCCLLTLVLALIAPSVYGTTYFPPNFKEVVVQASWIGNVYIEEARVLSAQFEGEKVTCGGQYLATPEEVFLGEFSEKIDFFSSGTLEIDSTYIVYLTKQDLKPKIMSTSSWAEPQRQKRERELLACQQASGLPFTIRGSTSEFQEKRLIDRKEGTYEDWISTPGFRAGSEVPRTVFYLEQVLIGGEARAMDDVLEQKYNGAENYWQYPSTKIFGGQSLTLWPSYRIKLKEIIANPDAIEERWVSAAGTIGEEVFVGLAGTEVPGGQIGSIHLDSVSNKRSCHGSFLFQDGLQNSATLSCGVNDDRVRSYLSVTSEGFLTGEIRGAVSAAAIHVLYGQPAKEMSKRLVLPEGKILQQQGKQRVVLVDIEDDN